MEKASEARTNPTDREPVSHAYAAVCEEHIRNVHADVVSSVRESLPELDDVDLAQFHGVDREPAVPEQAGADIRSREDQVASRKTRVRGPANADVYLTTPNSRLVASDLRLTPTPDAPPSARRAGSRC